MTTENEIKACPFCGVIPELVDTPTGPVLRHYNTGAEYFCPVPVELHGGFVAAWNRRAQVEVEPLVWVDNSTHSRCYTEEFDFYARDTNWQVIGREREQARGDCASRDDGKRQAEKWYEEQTRKEVK